ncbi:hypothetical protein [Kitasatospora sp. NPDC057198]|uniref:hypothetical protein n=1 Tax=Kitasatospora sp. NPDC057198 TaxID=3346046 RepID=UPI00363C672A
MIQRAFDAFPVEPQWVTDALTLPTAALPGRLAAPPGAAPAASKPVVRAPARH